MLGGVLVFDQRFVHVVGITFTALILAAQNGHTSCVEVLASGGAGVNNARTDGCTPLMLLAMFGPKNCPLPVLEAMLEGRSGQGAQFAEPLRASVQ